MSCPTCHGTALCSRCQDLLRRSIGATPVAAPVLNEKQLQAQVREVCRALGLLHYHTHRSQKSEPGFPDSAIIHPSGGTLFLLELKREWERPTLAQQRWLDALSKATAVVTGLVYETTLPDWVRRFQQG